MNFSGAGQAGIQILIFTLFSGLYAMSAHADWTSAGAQYSCDKNAGEFVLLPHDESSSGTPPLEKSFTKLQEGETNLVCKLGKRKLKARINVSPPASHGMCAGSGAVAVQSLIVDGVELLKERIDINWSCYGSEAVITKMVVRNKESIVTLEQTQEIHAKGDYAKFETKIVTDTFDVDKIAAQNAKIDNKQDSTQYQQEHLATRLPPENDLAKVFPTKFPKDSDIPLCAHWHSTFLNAITAPDKQRHGRIGGNKGEKTFIHKAHPQICQFPEDDGCQATAYLIPGDRVNIGIICGEWSYIQYESRTRSKPHTVGWVETTHLYDVDPVILAPEPLSSRGQDRTNKDPMLVAIEEGNLDVVNALIATDADPNGNGNGFPISTAIYYKKPEIVKTLLKAGADVNLGDGSCSRITFALDDEEIFDTVLKGGANINCRDKVNSSQTVLMAEARSTLYNWWHYRYEPIVARIDIPWRDPAVRVKKLINAGADVKALDSSGRNVFFYVTQSNNVDAAEVLLNLGADPNVSTDNNESCKSCGQQRGSTPLMSAFFWYSLTYDPTMFRMLLEHGADPDYRNKSRYNEEWDATTQGAVTFAGQTVLTRAAEDGYYTLARLALEHGADPTLPREDGKTPEQIAREYNHPKIAELIAGHVKKYAKQKK